MIKIYRTDNRVIGEEHAFEPGSWIQLTDPSSDEIELIFQSLRSVMTRKHIQRFR